MEHPKAHTFDKDDMGGDHSCLEGKELQSKSLVEGTMFAGRRRPAFEERKPVDNESAPYFILRCIRRRVPRDP